MPQAIPEELLRDGDRNGMFGFWALDPFDLKDFDKSRHVLFAECVIPVVQMLQKL